MISEEFLHRFWGPGGDRDKDDLTKRVVVDGEHYLICEEIGSLRFRGFGGHRFHIEFFDGRRATTTNLMHQGRIPAKYRERFPDNARFVTAAEAHSGEDGAYPMSRHIIPNAPGSPDTRVTTVGWDAPLTTFFAMAFDGDDEVFWIGMMPGEIPTLEALDAALKRYGVDLPFPVAAALAMDKANEGDRSDNVGRRLVDAILAEQERQS